MNLSQLLNKSAQALLRHRSFLLLWSWLVFVKAYLVPVDIVLNGEKIVDNVLTSLLMFCRPPSLCDLESLDAEFHKSLMWIKDADGSDLSTLDLTFSVDEEVCWYN